MNRLAVASDYDFIYRLYMDAENNRWLLYDPMDAAAFQPIFDELVKRGHLYVYVEEGVDVGMFKLQPMRHRNAHIVYLGGVALDRGMKGQGRGSRMIGEAVEIARAQGFTRMELTVATNNERAIGLYERHGFEREGVLKNYSYLKEEGIYLDEWVMGLML
jgi:putative acetyltransferase